MSRLDTLLNIDEQDDINRQRSLNINHLKFDPNRPIYQHVIRLAYFLEGEKNQELFQELMKNLQEMYPEEDVGGLIREYLGKQRDIDQFKQGYLNQLEEQEVNKQIATIKRQISQLNSQIKKTADQISKQKQRTQVLKIEIIENERFITREQNQIILQKMMPKQVEIPVKKQPQNNQNGKMEMIEVIPEEKCQYEIEQESKQKDFDQKRNQLEEKTKQNMQSFQKEYNLVVSEKKSLEQEIKKVKQEKALLEKVKNQHESIKKLSIELQNYVDTIQNDLKASKSLNAELQTTRNSQLAQKQKQQYEQIQAKLGKIAQPSFCESSEITQTKQFVQFKKIQEFNYSYWLYGLILGTVGLAVVSFVGFW